MNNVFLTSKYPLRRKVRHNQGRDCIVFCAAPFWKGAAFLHPAFEIQKEAFIYMETRVAVIGIIVEKYESAEALNGVLHEYGHYIIGRMGIPYREKKINVISVAIDAPQDVISALSGKIGKLDGVSAKTAFSNAIFSE